MATGPNWDDQTLMDGFAVLTGVLSAGLTATIVGAILQPMINHLLSSRLETLKTELRADAFEREIRFSRLYERRLEALSTLYSRLATAEIAVRRYAFASEQEVAPTAVEAFRLFVESWEQARIWIPEEIEAPLQALADQLFFVMVAKGTQPGVDWEGQPVKLVVGEIPQIRKELAGRIRQMIAAIEA